MTIPNKPRALKIAFCDFMYGCRSTDKLSSFNNSDNFVTRALTGTLDYAVCDMNEADILVYSSFGQRHRRFNGKKILFSGENILPNYHETDFSISSCYQPNEPRHLRLPQYIHYVDNPENLVKTPAWNPHQILKDKSQFCNFIVSNPRGPERNHFFKMLNRRKRVDSGGRCFNSMDMLVYDKLSFIKKYKFTLAFENSQWPGYTTEKLVEPMLAQSLPIYWGNPEVARDFNPRSFINISDFPNLEAAVDYILKVDADDELYLSYLKQPWFNDNRIPDWFAPSYTANSLIKFINAPWSARPRTYMSRGLRDHAIGTGLKRHITSLSCKLDNLLWNAGWH